MKLIFSTDYIQYGTVTIRNTSGQVLYKVITKSIFSFAKHRTTTIWKTIPNSSSPIHPNNPDGIALKGLNPGDLYADGGGLEEESSEIDMQDHFTQVAEIEWHTIHSSRIRWHSGGGGTNGLDAGEVKTSEFIPPKGITRMKRVFTGPDGRAYRWDLGWLACSLHLDDKPSALPIAEYHPTSLGLLPGTKAHKGYLEVHPIPVFSSDLTGSQHTNNGSHSDSNDEVDINSYTDYELESRLDDAGCTRLDPGMLDLIIVTFIYCDKLRRDQEEGNSVV